MVDWRTDTLDNPLFLIDLYLDPDSSINFPSLLPQWPGMERHVTVAHMGELEEQAPNWAYHATPVFRKNTEVIFDSETIPLERIGHKI